MDVGWVVDSVRMRPTATRIVNSSSTAITANTTVVLYRGAVPSVCVRGPSCKPVCGRICQVMAMARHLVPIERSSTQTENTNLSATTLSVAQIPTHKHNFPGYALYAAGANAGNKNHVGYGTWGDDEWLSKMGNTGSSWAHTHGVSNPSHSHTARTSFSVQQASRAVHYIMRTA